MEGICYHRCKQDGGDGGEHKVAGEQREDQPHGIVYDLLLTGARLSDGRCVDIGIRDGVIVAVEAQLQPVAAHVLALEGRLVLPGFVEAHTHLDKALTVEQIENQSGTLYEALRCMRHVHATCTAASIQERALRAAELFLAAGTTTLRTHVDVTPTIGLRSVEALLAVREAMRGRMDIQLAILSSDYTRPEYRCVREWAEEALRLGVDAVGGAPVLDVDPRAHIDYVFSLAERFGRPVDLHVDESDDPRDFSLPYVAQQTISRGFQGRVVAGHCCALAAVPHQDASQAIAATRAAAITVVTLPSANMYLQGRGDRGTIRRGLTRVQELLEAGVPVACGSDNVQDPFNPFGRGDPLLVANLFAHAAHLGSPAQQLIALDAVTATPARALGLHAWGLAPGCAADLVVLDLCEPRQVLALIPPRRYVIKAGAVVAETQSMTSFTLRHAPAPEAARAS